MLKLRYYQQKSLESLRDGFRAGHKTQVLYMPTGSGKTESSISLLVATEQKGKRAAMVMDRRILVDQTSARMDKYGIGHGVLMAGHWRWRPHEKIQICSAQTLEKCEYFPEIDLLIIDECHSQRKKVSDFVKNTGIRTIGLSASPFTKGLGAVYGNVVCDITTNDLVNGGSLVPLKVFVAKEIDMTGAKKVAGEWSQSEATDRGIKITGDIVAEWTKKTFEFFDKPEKTIIFCAGVAHGEDLQQKFNQAGYNFISISYRDDDDYKRDVIDEFSKPDSTITGLIATDILTKGFDVPSVKIGVSARPFSKSFSSHVQQMGRVMRPADDKQFALWLDHCIAGNQRVLTHRGLVAIDMILLSDRIWDGHEFVTHKGVINRGKRPVITYAGLTATADHLVYTADEGWCSLGYCADKQKAIVTTGIGRTALRKCDDYFTGCSVVGLASSTFHACSLRVRHLWLSLNNFFDKLAGRRNQGVSSMQSTKARSRMVKCSNRCNDTTMQKPEESPIRQLWWKGHRVQVRFSDFLRSLDSREFGLLTGTQGDGIGSYKQQRPLRSWKHSMGFKESEFVQHKTIKMDAFNTQVQNGKPKYSLCGFNIASIVSKWIDILRNYRKVSQTFSETEREVWDIQECGPRNSFTCEGLLVHNSGNYLRFRDDWEELFFNGVSALDDGKEKPKKEPSDKEKESAKCPKCSALWPAKSDICSNCGYVRTRKNEVIALPGELSEVDGLKKDKKHDAAYRELFYRQLLYYAKLHNYKDGWAFWKYKEKFKINPAWRKVEADFVSNDVMNFIRSQNIRHAKRRA